MNERLLVCMSLFETFTFERNRDVVPAQGGGKEKRANKHGKAGKDRKKNAKGEPRERSKMAEVDETPAASFPSVPLGTAS